MNTQILKLQSLGYGKKEIAAIEGQRAVKAHVVRQQVIDRALDLGLSTQGFPDATTIVSHMKGGSQPRQIFRRIERQAARISGTTVENAFKKPRHRLWSKD